MIYSTYTHLPHAESSLTRSRQRRTSLCGSSDPAPNAARGPNDPRTDRYGERAAPEAFSRPGKAAGSFDRESALLNVSRETAGDSATAATASSAKRGYFGSGCWPDEERNAKTMMGHAARDNDDEDDDEDRDDWGVYGFGRSRRNSDNDGLDVEGWVSGKRCRGERNDRRDSDGDVWPAKIDFSVLEDVWASAGGAGNSSGGSGNVYGGARISGDRNSSGGWTGKNRPRNPNGTWASRKYDNNDDVIWTSKNNVDDGGARSSNDVWAPENDQRTPDRPRTSVVFRREYHDHSHHHRHRQPHLNSMAHHRRHQRTSSSKRRAPSNIFLTPPLDLSSSVYFPAFVCHMYDPPFSSTFRRRAVIDSFNTGTATLYHPIRWFWNTKTLPYFYHLPLTIRAANKAALVSLDESAFNRRRFFERTFKIRVYAVYRRPVWLERMSVYPFNVYRSVLDDGSSQLCPRAVHRHVPFSSERFYREFGGPQCDHLFPGNVIAATGGSSAAAAVVETDRPHDEFCVHLFRSCSVNYTHVSSDTLHAKLQVCMNDLDTVDCGLHQTTVVDEINELRFPHETLRAVLASAENETANACASTTAADSSCSLLRENKRLQELDQLKHGNLPYHFRRVSAQQPWFDRDETLMYGETYLAQHMLPFPTLNEFKDVLLNTRLRDNDYFTDYGIPSNLLALPTFSFLRGRDSTNGHGVTMRPIWESYVYKTPGSVPALSNYFCLNSVEHRRFTNDAELSQKINRRLNMVKSALSFAEISRSPDSSCRLFFNVFTEHTPGPSQFLELVRGRRDLVFCVSIDVAGML